MAAGSEVDIKCTVLKDWMIPREAIDELCLVVRIDDRKSKFWIGVVRASEAILRRGKNRDQKVSISAEGKKAIQWIVEEGDLPRNLLAELDVADRERILGQTSGQARVTELFRTVLGRPVPRTVIETVARQKDPMKRVRDARIELEDEGILLLGHQGDHPRIAASLGFEPPKKGEILAVRPLSGPSRAT